MRAPREGANQMRAPNEGAKREEAAPAASDSAARTMKAAVASGVGVVLGWLLALAALVAGYLGWGWRGVVLALTVIAFWLLLQFSRSLRVLRAAGGRPAGQVPSAVMLHSRLARGMRLLDIVKLTHSLGVRVSDEPEVWAWRDAGGDELRVVVHRARVITWTLRRAAQAPS